jgi:hypothetical protein
MLHLANDYIRSRVIIGTPAKNTYESFIFNQYHSTEISVLLKQDAMSYIYSSLVTFGDALRGVKEGFYSWSTIKLYYSVFYALRAILAFENHCLFYIGTTPCSLIPLPNSYPKKEKGTTHKVVFELFKRSHPNSVFYTQDIDLTPAFDWLLNQREHCNYKQPKFIEPATPAIWTKVANGGLRQMIQAYSEDNMYLNTFDPDHAILALPIKVIQEALSKLSNHQDLFFEDEESEYISSILKDNNGNYICFEQFN